jgi:hypothetical protein
MSVSLPNGAVLALASGYSAAKTVTILTNAAPAVATSTAHGMANGDFVEVTSGWAGINGKIFRISGVTTNTFELEGSTCTSTTTYPAGSGIGSVRSVSGWTQLAQILTSASEGGDQQFFTYQFLEGDRQTRIPTVKSPDGMNISIADDASLAGYILAATANDDRLPRAVRVTLPSASKLLYNCYVSLNRTPSLTVNTAMECKVTLSQLAEVVRYAS